MNKIVLEQNSLIEENIDNSITISFDEKNEFLDVKTLTINVIKDTEVNIIQRATEKVKLNININVSKGTFCNLIEYKEDGKYKIGYKYNLEENSFLNVIKINDVKKIKEFVIFNLNGRGCKVDYLLKTVAKAEEKYDLMVYHNKKNTVSNIINHGVNIKNGEIKFDVSGFVPNGITDCALSQDNRIINLTDNKCVIKPNLFIDENDVIASHSAHIGKCDDDKMFYLKSRGISEKDAQSLLIKGFLTSKLNDEKDYMDKVIDRYW